MRGTRNFINFNMIFYFIYSQVRARAARLQREQRDEVKHMNQMVLYSKCVAVRHAPTCMLVGELHPFGNTESGQCNTADATPSDLFALLKEKRTTYL